METVFKVNNLSYMYKKNRVQAVKDISFEVKKGEIFGILGPSGAGKSTTQKVLIKLLKDYQGSIEYLGRNLESYDNSFYEQVGVGFELPVHFSKLSAMENMKFFARLYRKNADIDGLMKAVGLFEDKDRLVGEYSKGMKMRLNFVRAMLNEPEILFLDEATNGLDPKNARIIKDLVRDFKNKGGTVILSTHLMNDVEELCDRIAFISGGEIREISTPRELKIRYGKRILTVEYRLNGETKERVFDLDGIGKNEAFLDIVQNHEIETMHSGETSLDDIFIQVTGERIDEPS